MNRKASSFLILLLSVFTSLSVHAFCVQTFNAYGAFYAADIAQRTRETAEQLKADACSAIFLQEVFNRNRMNMYQQFSAELASTHENVPTGLTTSSGLQSLIKGEVLETKFYRFQVQTLVGIRKGFSVTRVRLKDLSSEVVLVNVHLHHSSTDSRMSQLAELVEWRHKNPDLPLILAGDLNSNPDSIEYDFLVTALNLVDLGRQAIGGTYPAGYCTYCKDNPRSWDGFLSSKGPQDQTYDYVFSAPDPKTGIDFRGVSSQVNLKGRTGFTWSDHYGVQVELKEVRQKRRSNQEKLEQLSASLIQLKDLANRHKDARYRRNLKSLLVVEDHIKQLEQKAGFFYNYLMRL